MLKDNCLFCKIIQGKEPAYKIYEDEKTFAFLNLYPIAKGHMLIVPKTHFASVEKGPKEYLAAVMTTAKKIIKHSQEKSKYQDFNLIINNSPIAGQLIPHLHLHLIPRKEGDGLNFIQPSQQASEEELRKIQKQLIISTR